MPFTPQQHNSASKRDPGRSAGFGGQRSAFNFGGQGSAERMVMGGAGSAGRIVGRSDYNSYSNDCNQRKQDEGLKDSALLKRFD